MTAAPILEVLANAIRHLRSRTRIDAYIFGSAVKPTSAWSDVDILLVCQDEAAGQPARRALGNLCREFPIDLTIMTVEEETEFDFVRSEKCKWFAAVDPETDMAIAGEGP